MPFVDYETRSTVMLDPKEVEALEESGRTLEGLGMRALDFAKKQCPNSEGCGACMSVDRGHNYGRVVIECCDSDCTGEGVRETTRALVDLTPDITLESPPRSIIYSS